HRSDDGHRGDRRGPSSISPERPMTMRDRSFKPFRITLAALAFALAAAGCSEDSPTSDNNTAVTTPTDATALNHIVVIYLENRSFDNTYGEFVGAEGLNTNGYAAAKQIDASGAAYTTLPQVVGSPVPTNLANTPFNIAQYVAPATPTRDLIHRW